MQIIVPMAGLGKRFLDAGYALPKPLINVAGKPMIARALADLPPAESHVFICHPDHVREHAIDRTLETIFPGCSILVPPALTEGQASSVLLAKGRVDLDRPALVAACDNTHLYDRGRFTRLTLEEGVDAAVWTYRGEPRVLVEPRWYGWVRTRPISDARHRDRAARRARRRSDREGRYDDVVEVSVKRPISTDLLRDHVVSGTFWFRRAGEMFDAIDQMIRANERTNGEFYMDAVANVLLRQGRRVVAFEVDKYIGWGTPADLEDYLRWRRHFESAGALRPALAA